MMKENNIGIFNKILQVESTSQLGSMLYSMNTLNSKIQANISTGKVGV